MQLAFVHISYVRDLMHQLVIRLLHRAASLPPVSEDFAFYVCHWRPNYFVVVDAEDITAG